MDLVGLGLQRVLVNWYIFISPMTDMIQPVGIAGIAATALLHARPSFMYVPGRVKDLHTWLMANGVQALERLLQLCNVS